jgi:aspartyl/asparaginyl-tRNA synthetase
VIESKNFSPEQFEEISTLGIESSLSLTGTVSKHPKKDEYELQVSDYTVF